MGVAHSNPWEEMYWNDCFLFWCIWQLGVRDKSKQAMKVAQHTVVENSMTGQPANGFQQLHTTTTYTIHKTPFFLMASMWCLKTMHCTATHWSTCRAFVNQYWWLVSSFGEPGIIPLLLQQVLLSPSTVFNSRCMKAFCTDTQVTQNDFCTSQSSVCLVVECCSSSFHCLQSYTIVYHFRFYSWVWTTGLLDLVLILVQICRLVWYHDRMARQMPKICAMPQCVAWKHCGQESRMCSEH